MRIDNKIAVFFGGAGAMAAAAAKEFLKEGAAAVVLADQGAEALQKAEGQFAEYGDKLQTYAADVRSYSAVEGVVKAVAAKYGRIDILVNFAGIQVHKPIDVMTSEEWQSVLDVNLTGMFNTCRAVVPFMKANNYGRIVNISSIGGRTGRTGVGVCYAASKAGVVGLTQTLAKELAPWTITANVIAPGPMGGKMFYENPPEMIAALEKQIALGRVGKMEEIAYAVLFLASDESAWTTGEVLDVNGGSLI